MNAWMSNGGICQLGSAEEMNLILKFGGKITDVTLCQIKSIHMPLGDPLCLDGNSRYRWTQKGWTLELCLLARSYNLSLARYS